MALKKSKKLSPKEYEDTLRGMRAWAPHLRDEAAKLVWHIEALSEELEKALMEVSKLRQPDLFKKQEVPKSSQYAAYAVKSDEFEKVPLAKRLKDMIEANETDTEEWRLTLKWNELSHEKAVKLAMEQIGNLE